MLQKLKKNFLIRKAAAHLPSSWRPYWKTYNKVSKLLEVSDQWTKHQYDEFQLKQLQEITRYAWNKIPGYQKHWRSHQFYPEQLKTLRDIERIPFITKELLQSGVEDFSLSDKSDLIYLTTGGSTGKPFGFYNLPQDAMMEMAFIHSLWRRHDPSVGLATKSTILRGEKLSGRYRLDPMVGLLLSSYEINLDSVLQYIDLIDRYRTPVLQAYPSALYLMARIMQTNNLRLKHKFNCIMLGSEPLYEFQKKLIREVFETRLSFWYGHTEKAVLAGNCRESDRLHIFPQYGITEIIKPDGKVAAIGESGEIVGTSFWCRATPIIRYKTQDYAAIVGVGCKHCGRAHALFDRIDGRLQEFIVSKSGNLVSMTAINMHDDIFDELQQFRFYQDRVGLVLFQYISRPGLEKVNEEKICKGLKAKLSSDFDLEIRKVEKIDQTSAGKLRFLDQKLDVLKFTNDF